MAPSPQSSSNVPARSLTLSQYGSLNKANSLVQFSNHSPFPRVFKNLSLTTTSTSLNLPFNTQSSSTGSKVLQKKSFVPHRNTTILSAWIWRLLSRNEGHRKYDHSSLRRRIVREKVLQVK
ncbi:hypothetical protein ONS95_015063 [Cadophora gregata]|uniref:uncharacterized protein n=1 Tax=Cadophora gregata TaxID=51156 RepID=UPI0026DBDC62|nr:uncharacterized protein ONS95_015063 [Cadophora gregata]KAK0118166.1 hypothetical protein ONS95_015063 [Cadophora gregata]